MFEKFFTKEVQNYIEKNLKSDINKLLLKGSPFKDISPQELVNQIFGRKKYLEKMSDFTFDDKLIFPPKIHLEQSSSSFAAILKASWFKGNEMIDLTGGFGIDAFAFCDRFKRVYHCERDENLSNIVKHNVAVLNRPISCHTGNSSEILKQLNINFDLIYVDPSRRDSNKNKVFMWEDCEPNIPLQINNYFKYSCQVLIKGSPMVDIHSCINQIPNIKQISIVCLNNEVKELLIHCVKAYQGPTQIYVHHRNKDKDSIFQFEHGKTPEKINYSVPKKYLYEPNAGIQKSGGIDWLTETFDCTKIAPFTQLFSSEKYMEEFPGRKFVINRVCNYNKKEILSLLTENKANITTRNFPDKVEIIRKKLKIKEGGNQYLFFVTLHDKKKKVLICSKK